MLSVNPGLNFGLDGAGDSGNGVSRDPASQEASEAITAAGFMEGLDEGFEVGEVLREGGEMRVLGEESIGFGLELEQSFNGG